MHRFWGKKNMKVRCFSVCVPSDWSEPYSQPSRKDGESNAGPLQKLSTDRFRPGTAVLCLQCFQWNFVYSQISVRPLPPVKLKSESPLPSHSVSEVPLCRNPSFYVLLKRGTQKFHFFFFPPTHSTLPLFRPLSRLLGIPVLLLQKMPHEIAFIVSVYFKHMPDRRLWCLNRPLLCVGHF